MRVTGGSGGAGSEFSGVLAGVYPTPLLTSYRSAKGFETWDDASETEGVFIPSNYNDTAHQTNIDDTYDSIQMTYPDTTGPIDDTQSLKYLAPSFANYKKAKIIRIAPFGNIITTSQNVPTGGTGNSNVEFKFCKTDTNKFLIAWVTLKDGNYRAYIRIADRTSGKIIWGDAQEITGVNLSNSTYTLWDVQQLTTDKFILIFNNASNSNRLSAVAVTLDVNDEINAVGTILEVSTSTNQTIVCTEYAATDKVVMEWANAANVVAISASGTTLAAGTPVSVLGSAGAGSLAHFRYLSDNNLVNLTQNVTANGNLYCRVLSISGTTITVEAEDSRSVGSAAATTIRNMGTTSSTRAHAQVNWSTSYDLWSINISGTAATFDDVDDIDIDSNDRVQFNRFDGKVYVIDTQLDQVRKYDTDHLFEGSFDSFIDLGTNWPSIPSSGNAPSARVRDLRDGISLSIDQFGNLQTKNDVFLSAMLSPDVDVDIEINSINVHAAGTPTFGLLTSIESSQDSATVQIEIINQGGAMRIFEPQQFITTVT